MSAAAATSAASGGWRARLALGFRRDGDVTRLARRTAEGPLQVQRPFYPGDGACHVYVLHPPGGLVGGDQLDIDIDAGAGTHVLLTTPAAGKCYRSAGPVARQHQTLRVRGGACLEWLPLETIVFSGARARSVTRVDLDEDARVIAWEIVCLGRPAAGECFSSGWFAQDMELYRQGRPLLLERNRFDGGGAVLTSRWGLDGRPVAAVMIASPCDAGMLDAVRAELPDGAAATSVDGVLLVRAIGAHAEAVRHTLMCVWHLLRRSPGFVPPAAVKSADGAIAVAAPRIWNT